MKINRQNDSQKYTALLETYPRCRNELPPKYIAIYDEHYLSNREGQTKITKLSSKLEKWLHKKVAKTSSIEKKTLEIGAGTLNQLSYERSTIYDVVEPYTLLYRDKPETKKVRNFYKDIADIPLAERYDRIVSVACFEHICNLPEVLAKCTSILNRDGVLAISIPNEGRFLWKFAYTLTTGREFHKKYGLDYEVMMRYEHVNTADEIEILLMHFFEDVRVQLFGIGKMFSLYRYYECRIPRACERL